MSTVLGSTTVTTNGNELLLLKVHTTLPQPLVDSDDESDEEDAGKKIKCHSRFVVVVSVTFNWVFTFF
jgi:hypothetical protein